MFKALKEQPEHRVFKVLRVDKALLVLVFKARQAYRAL